MEANGDGYLGVDPDTCAFFKGGWEGRIRRIAEPYARLKPEGGSGERVNG
ncbi:MAG: hypothetical protein LBK04_03060 [Clostridiales Family XIII bacterium]|nr:hypothetical protein [Clostridiales Family XIII bacterium]